MKYKQVDSVSLHMDLFYPSNFKESEKYPAIVFFFGGGWIGGSIDQFEPHARYFSQRGMIGILADYRVRKRHGTSPFDAVSDAKSAIRYIRKNADSLNVDSTKIVASGGSAGGHLAAATAVLENLEELNEDLTISSKPDALVLFNPVVDNGPSGYGYERVGERYLEISPLHNISKGAPPAIIFLGTKDKLIPVETVRKFKEKMEKVGSECKLHLYEGQGHGFFNYKNPEFYKKTVYEADKFLESLGFLKDR